MSKIFISVYCKGCQIGYRNRQALSRHQNKTNCSGFYHENNISESPIDAIMPVGQVPSDSIELILSNSTLSLVPFGRGRSLDDIIEQEMQGENFSAYNSLDLKGLTISSAHSGFDEFLATNGPPIIQIPMQLISGSKIGYQAVFMKL
jgi:hypothetical protein